MRSDARLAVESSDEEGENVVKKYDEPGNRARQPGPKGNYETPKGIPVNTEGQQSTADIATGRQPQG